MLATTNSGLSLQQVYFFHIKKENQLQPVRMLMQNNNQ
jgi:hypothetical protein